MISYTEVYLSPLPTNLNIFIFFTSFQMENPWNIDSIYDLQYFNCPSCIFRDHSKQEIINHAYEFHPNSIHYLGMVTN